MFGSGNVVVESGSGARKPTRGVIAEARRIGSGLAPHAPLPSDAEIALRRHGFGQIAAAWM
jgi:hypothetical protein